MKRDTLSDWLSYLEIVHSKPIDLGLERVAAVRHRMGLQPAFPIISVAGTNGKGSTCAMLESVLSAAGYRVGCYTSPHLIAYNERVRIGRVQATDADLCTAFAGVEAARTETPLTYFEYGTLAAMWLFCQQRVDLAILEVGLGGRLDAVNIFDADCAIITSVDLDHQEYLGYDRESIGFEKAGILRPAKPAVYGDANPPASVVEHARSIGADLIRLGSDFGYTKMEAQWQFRGRRGRRHALPYPALRGQYQLNNASACLAALDELRDRLPVALQDIKRGLLEIDLPARFQVLPGRPQIILDVAHNPHAAAALASSLGGMGYVDNTLAVFSMLKDKDIGSVIDAVKHRIDRWYIAPIEAARGANLDQLWELFDQRGLTESTRRFPGIAEAYRQACKDAAENDRIIVFGSFYTVAVVLREQTPRPA